MNDMTVLDLREKTEEADLNSILKPNVGGYTKKSVLEYLAYIKKQHQDLKETFAEELERLQNENDELRKDNASLRTELDEMTEKYNGDEAELKECREELNDQRARAEISVKEAEDCRTMLDAVCAKNDELTQAIADINTSNPNGIISTYIAKMPTEEDLAETDLHISDLLHSAELLESEMQKRAAAFGEKVRALDELTHEQMKNSRETLMSLQNELRERINQNELLESEKEGLSRRVGDLLDQNLMLGRENSRLKATNVILQRELETRK